MKVLVVHNAYKIAGGEDAVVDNEIKLLRDVGCEVVTYMRSNLETDTMSLPQKLGVPFRAVWSGRTVREVRRLIREERIDVVHVHNTLLLVSPSVFHAAFREHVPVVMTVHNFRLLCPGALFLRDGRVCEDCIGNHLLCGVRHRCYRDSLIWSGVNAAILSFHRRIGTYNKLHYVALTDFNKQKILELNKARGVRITPEQITVRPNFAADFKEIAPSPDYPDRPFLYVGRLSVEKGIGVLMKAYTEYLSADGTKRLIICGDGPMSDEVEAFAKENDKHVIYRGRVSKEELIRIMKTSKAVIVPSICYEGMPMAIVESYSAGIPVIGSNTGNVASCIRDGETGRCFEMGDSAALAKLLIEFADMDNAQYAKYCEQAGAEYEAKFTEAVAGASILDLYNRLDTEK